MRVKDDTAEEYLMKLINLAILNYQVGTSRYMAPEKLKGVIDDGNIWESLCMIDIYAASIVTYEVMSRCYFEFDSDKEG